MIYNNRLIVSKPIGDGDFIRIDDGIETIADGVLFVFFFQESESRWFTFPLTGRPGITLGRAEACDIVLPHVSVSKIHGRIVREPSGYFIVDNGSTNGGVVNNRRVVGRQQLHEKDVIVITSVKLIFTSAAIFYCVCRSGISVDVMNVTITRGKGQRAFVTGSNISLHVKPGNWWPSWAAREPESRRS